MAKFCKNCGAELVDGAKFCANCGTPFKETPKFCANCGAELADGARFCANCGASLPGQTANAPKAPETKAAETAPHETKAVDSGNSGTEAPKTGAAAAGQYAGYKGISSRMPQRDIHVPDRFTKKQTDAAPPARSYDHNAQERRTAEVRDQKPDSGKPPVKTGRIAIRFLAVLLVGVFIFTAFIKPGFLIGGGGGGGEVEGTGTGTGTVKEKDPSQLTVVKTENGSVSKSSPVVTLCDVTVDVVPQMLESGDRQVTVSKLENTSGSDGVKHENYELNMGKHETFKVPVEVTFPCKISSGVDPTVEHYNEATGEWDPLISMVDEEKGTVSAYFGSFSPARVSYLPVGINPNVYLVATPDKSKPFDQKIVVASNYWKILQRINPSVYSDEVTKYIDDPENYAVDMPKLSENMTAEAAYQAFTKVNTIWTFCDPMINIGIAALPPHSQSKVVSFMIDNSESLGNAMNVVPFIMMSAQLAYDLYQMEGNSTDTAALNLYKNLITASGTIYSLTTGYSHLGFTLAFFGVSLFGMELDYFIDAAKAEQAANVKAVFEAYYEDVEPFDAYHWYEVFEDAYWKNDGNADKAMREVKTAVDSYCERFWTEVYKEDNEDILFAATSAGYKNVFFNASAEQKKILTEQQKARVWNLIETKSMKIIRRFMLERLQEKTYKELCEITEVYNKTFTVEIKETVEKNSTAEYTGCTVCFGSDGVPFPDWHINIPDDDEYDDGWSTEFECSVYGYMKMGMPDQVLIYEDEDDFKNGGKPIAKQTFEPELKIDRDHIVVEFHTGEKYEASSDTFTGYTFSCSGGAYGGSLYYSTINKAIEDAAKKMTIKLDKNGDFNVTSTGSEAGHSHGDTGPNDDSDWNVTATLGLKGHIDKGTGDGTFTMTLTVSYHYSWGSPFYGTDRSSVTITYRNASGEISGTIYDDTFDPVFEGYANVNRSGTLSHEKGTGYGQSDSSDSINKTEEDVYFKIRFIASN